MVQILNDQYYIHSWPFFIDNLFDLHTAGTVTQTLLLLTLNLILLTILINSYL